MPTQGAFSYANGQRQGGCVFWMLFLGCTLAGIVIIVNAFDLRGEILISPADSPPVSADAQALAVANSPTSAKAPASPRVLFTDTFDASLNPAWEPAVGKWLMVNERLKVIRFVEGEALLLVGTSAWRNYAVDLEVGAFERDWLRGDSNQVTIHVRRQDQRNSIWFEVSARAVVCGIQLEGEDLIVHQAAEDLGRGDHHLRIEAQGNCYKFFINGQRICFFADDSFSAGPVGLRVGQKTNANQLWIDNFSVTELP